MSELGTRSLEGVTIGISISESPDLGILGLSPLHVEDALVRLSEHLFAEGATVLYGGDLRQGGFTRVLFNAARTYNGQDETIETKVQNLIAWPIHQAWSKDEIKKAKRAFRGHGTLRLIDPPEGYVKSGWPNDAVGQRKAWCTSLTSMREMLADECDAMIFLGGKVEGYVGRWPGVAEEAHMAISKGKAVYLCGGFGGITHDICEHVAKGIKDYSADRASAEAHAVTSQGYKEALASFDRHVPADLANGLTEDDVTHLANAVDSNKILMLVLRGLAGRFAGAIWA